MSTATLLEHRPARTMPAPPTDEFVEPDFLYEMIDGRIVEIERMSVYSTLVATRLSFALQSHVEPSGLGTVIVEGLFKIPTPRDRRRKRRPDLAFVSAQRWPLDRQISITVNAWEVVPDLAVEVISPTNGYEEILEKLGDYFGAGVRLAWVFSPAMQLAQVFESMEKSHTLMIGAELDGGDVLPDFRVPLAKLFPPVGPDDGAEV